MGGKGGRERDERGRKSRGKNEGDIKRILVMRRWIKSSLAQSENKGKYKKKEKKKKKRRGIKKTLVSFLWRSGIDRRTGKRGPTKQTKIVGKTEWMG